MDAAVVATGLIVLCALTAVALWFELRMRERRSIARIDRACEAILDTMGVLRCDLVHAGVHPEGGPGEEQMAPCGSEGSERGGAGATDPEGEAPPVSARREIPLEEMAGLDDETIAEIDALAEAQGMSRAEMISALVEQGAEVVKRRGVPVNDGAAPGSRRR